jgi:hypothetical protein
MFEKPSDGNLVNWSKGNTHSIIFRDGFFFPSVKNIVHKYNISICKHDKKGHVLISLSVQNVHNF